MDKQMRDKKKDRDRERKRKKKRKREREREREREKERERLNFLVLPESETMFWKYSGSKILSSGSLSRKRER